MSYPPPPPPGYAPPPGYGPPPGGKRRLRGRIPLRLALIFGVVGLALVIVGAVVLATKSISRVDDFDRVSISAGSGTVKFDDTGKFLAYYEHDGFDIDEESPPTLAVVLTSPSGKKLPLTTFYGGKSTTVDKLSYNYDGHDGAALYEFDIKEKGTYQVQIQANGNLPSDAQLAFGESIAGGLVVGVLLILPGVLLVIAAIVLLIVGLVKRSRHKSELARYPYGPPPPGGPPPNYPPQPGFGGPSLSKG